MAIGATFDLPELTSARCECGRAALDDNLDGNLKVDLEAGSSLDSDSYRDY